MGTGFSDGIKIKDIEILNHRNGKPIINLYGRQKKKIRDIESSSISISNEGGFVVSIATFLRKKYKNKAIIKINFYKGYTIKKNY